MTLLGFVWKSIYSRNNIILLKLEILNSTSIIHIIEDNDR